MSPFTVDKRDIQFVLYEYLDVENRICKLPKFSEFDRETFDMVLETMTKLGTDLLAPLNKVMDREGLQFVDHQVITPPGYKEAYQALCENGLAAPANDAKWGGGGLPMTINTALTEILISASVAFAMTPGLTSAAGHVIEAYGTDAMRSTYLEKMFTGTWSGTMCLTESSAGSAVGDLKTKAKREGDHYLIEGEKIFISSGEHDLTENIVHLVLARIEGAPKGIRGVSLFLVPKFLVNEDGSIGEANNVVCGNIEHKMGIKGSPTCTMVLGADGPCKGWLIGEEHQGIRYMFLMMNEARIGVGMQGLSCAAGSYQEALQYAAERVQGVDVTEMKNVDARRVPIIEHPDVRRNLLTMKAFAEGMRALLYSSALYADLSLDSEDEQERTTAQNMLELITPICKAYCSDWGFHMTELGIQVLGGYGYTQEYPQEQYCRDCKIASIYEGTNGIQALDLLGRKVSGKGGLLFMTWLMRLNDFINDQQEHEAIGPFVKKLEAARDRLSETVMAFQQAGMGGDVYFPVLNATPFLEMFGHIALGYHLCAMGVIADKKLQEILAAAGAKDDAARAKVIEENPEAKFYDGKLHSMRYFVDTYLPKAIGIADTIRAGNRSPLEINFAV
jgi:alkylation response protein AidB-like acyl-CoA dehydrogenase